MFRLGVVGTKLNERELHGLCIFGDSESEVLTIADMALQHFETVGPTRIIAIGFRLNERGKYDFLMDFGPLIGRVDIRDVEAAVPECIERALERVGAFFIVLGYGESNSTFVDTSTFRLTQIEMTLDGRIVRGTRGVSINWTQLLK